jgi:C1A family cysteine protease
MSFKKIATYTALVFGIVGLVALTGFTSVISDATTNLYSSIGSVDDQEVVKAYLNFVA